MAVIAHGDYCDSHTYVTKILPFTSNVDEIVKFVETVQCTGIFHVCVCCILYGCVVEMFSIISGSGQAKCMCMYVCNIISSLVTFFF